MTLYEYLNFSESIFRQGHNDISFYDALFRVNPKLKAASSFEEFKKSGSIETLKSLIDRVTYLSDPSLLNYEIYEPPKLIISLAKHRLECHAYIKPYKDWFKTGTPHLEFGFAKPNATKLVAMYKDKPYVFAGGFYDSGFYDFLGHYPCSRNKNAIAIFISCIPELKSPQVLLFKTDDFDKLPLAYNSDNLKGIIGFRNKITGFLDFTPTLEPSMCLKSYDTVHDFLKDIEIKQ